jgi:hypothetical protein
MKLNLQDIKIYCLTVPWATERQEQVTKMFQKLGKDFEFLQGQKTDPYAKGLAQSHIEALEKSGDTPCLILEDDAVWNKWHETSAFANTIILPDWADALYVGTSVFGRIKGQTVSRGLAASDWDSKLIRVYNKLSMHAVCHLSNAYKKNCIRLFSQYIAKPEGGCDDIIADNMKYWNVFSIREAFFHQSDGHNDGATKEVLRTIL